MTTGAGAGHRDGMDLRTLRTITSLAAAGIVLIAGCAPAPTPAAVTPVASTAALTPVPTAPGPTPVSTPAASTGSIEPSRSQSAIVLRQAPANLGCDSIGLDYTHVTFDIDPAAEEQVSAVTDTNVRLLTYWSPEFRPGPGGELAVRDPAGQAVATDGEVLAVGNKLHGYFVCMAPSALYVLANEPS